MYLDRLEFKNDLLTGIDPRCRIGAGLCLILSGITLSQPLLLGVFILGMLVILWKDIKRALARLIPVNIFVLILVLTLPLGTLWPGAGGIVPEDTGKIILAGSEPAFREALKAALVYALRINAAALICMVLIIPLGIGGLTNALMKLRCPKKLAALFLLTHRYLFVMYRRVFVSAASLRLRQPRQSIPDQWRSYTAVFGTALVSAILRSRKIGRALQVRGFNGAFPVTRAFTLRAGDLLFLGVSLLLSFSLRVLDRLLTGETWNF
jgi:energy-coupling factor transporter transmembrane protein EcfT